MKFSHRRLIQPCRKNQYCLSLTFMGGDADEFFTGKIYSNTFSDEIAALVELYTEQLKQSYGGCSGQEASELCELAIAAVLKSPILRKVAVDNEEYADDHASEYLFDLGHGCWGDTDVERVIYSINVTYFDEAGDEYLLEEITRDTFRSKK